MAHAAYRVVGGARRGEANTGRDARVCGAEITPGASLRPDPLGQGVEVWCRLPALQRKLAAEIAVAVQQQQAQQAPPQRVTYPEEQVLIG